MSIFDESSSYSNRDSLFDGLSKDLEQGLGSFLESDDEFK
jgi:hypothetical protein